MISSIERDLTKIDNEIGQNMNILKVDELGRVKVDELESMIEDLNFSTPETKNDKESNKVSIEDEKERVKKIIKKLDNDGDGLIDVQEFTDLIEKVKEYEVLEIPEGNKKE